jgi:translation initiation factor 3 subunit F
VSASDALIQDFYGREVANPIHLTVDTAFTDDQANIKAYVSTPLTLGDRPLAAQFHEIQLDLRLVEAERLGCMFFSSCSQFHSQTCIRLFESHKL